MTTEALAETRYSGVRAGLVLVLLLIAAARAEAQANPAAGPAGLPPLLREVNFSPALDAQVPLELSFRDESGRSVPLGEYFGVRPVLLALVYYECPMLCNQVLNGVVGSLKAVSFDAGKEFSVVTVSINPRETPGTAAEKKRGILEHYRRRDAGQGWHFLTGDEPSITALAEAVGFRYAYDPKTDLYAHASGILVVTPQGKISRYFYGIEYPPRDLRLALVEASANKIGSPADRLLLFCYEYDPATGKYGALVMNLVRLGGAATLLGLGILIFVFRRRENASGRLKPGAG